jgi:hypothetical protein
MDDTRRLIERARRSAQEARLVAAETRRLVRTSREIQTWTARVQGRIEGQTGSSFRFSRDSNRLLGLLPLKEFERLTPLLQGVALAAKVVLHRANRPVDYLYFPISGLLSATVTMQDGSAIEVGLIGNEGAAGLVALTGDTAAAHDVVVRCPARDCESALTPFAPSWRGAGCSRKWSQVTWAPARR